MTTGNQPISAAQVAKAVRAWVPGAAEARLLPQVSDGTGVTRHSTWVSFYAADGTWIDDVTRAVSEMLLRALSPLPGRDRGRPQVFDVATAEWLPPVVPSRLSPLAAPDLALDCARSLAEGHMDPPVWDDDAPVPERDTEDVPVAGEAL